MLRKNMTIKGIPLDKAVAAGNERIMGLVERKK